MDRHTMENSVLELKMGGGSVPNWYNGIVGTLGEDGTSVYRSQHIYNISANDLSIEDGTLTKIFIDDSLELYKDILDMHAILDFYVYDRQHGELVRNQISLPYYLGDIIINENTAIPVSIDFNRVIVNNVNHNNRMALTLNISDEYLNAESYEDRTLLSAIMSADNIRVKIIIDHTKK